MLARLWLLTAAFNFDCLKHQLDTVYILREQQCLTYKYLQFLVFNLAGSANSTTDQKQFLRVSVI